VSEPGVELWVSMPQRGRREEHARSRGKWLGEHIGYVMQDAFLGPLLYQLSDTRHEYW
jgi:hypothetical protein